VLVIEKPQMIEMLYKEPTLAERFLTHMLTRNIRIGRRPDRSTLQLQREAAGARDG
jgi:hypothetical protein